MSAPTVNRRDIRLEEEPGELSFAQTGAQGPPSVWIATLDGPLSTGEWVAMSRDGNSSAEALAALEGAIVENGWEIK